MARLRQRAHLDLVEAAVRGEFWTDEVVTRLMAQCKRDRTTIYRMKQEVLKKLVDEEEKNLPERRANFLLQLRRVQQAAFGDKAYSPAGKLLDMEHKILGLDRVPLPEVEDEDPSKPVDTSLETILVEVRKMRKSAQAGHSYVAANNLLEREHTIIESIRSRDEAKRAQDLAHLDEGALVDELVANLDNLPDALKIKLRTALGV